MNHHNNSNMHYDLGKTAAFGTDAVTQCNAFRLYINNRCGRVQGAYLHMNHVADGRCAMQVIFDGSRPDELRWAQRVRDEAENVWHLIERGIIPDAKILIRSRGYER